MTAHSAIPNKENAEWAAPQFVSENFAAVNEQPYRYTINTRKKKIQFVVITEYV